jgi:hypothetical protein
MGSRPPGFFGVTLRRRAIALLAPFFTTAAVALVFVARVAGGGPGPSDLQAVYLTSLLAAPGGAVDRKAEQGATSSRCCDRSTLAGAGSGCSAWRGDLGADSTVPGDHCLIKIDGRGPPRCSRRAGSERVAWWISIGIGGRVVGASGCMLVLCYGLGGGSHGCAGRERIPRVGPARRAGRWRRPSSRGSLQSCSGRGRGCRRLSTVARGGATR